MGNAGESLRFGASEDEEREEDSSQVEMFGPRIAGENDNEGEDL